MRRAFFILFFCSIFVLTGCEKKEISASPEKLEIWSVGEKTFLQAIGVEFGAEIKNTKLQITDTEFPDEESLESAVTNAMAEKKGPDIIFIDGDFIHTNPLKFSPLTENSQLLIPQWQKEFVPLVTEDLILNGSLYGVPLEINTLSMIFNTEYLRNAGINPQNIQTWKNVAESSLRLTQKDNSIEQFSVSGVALGIGKNISRSPEIIENILFQTVGNLFSEDKNEAIFSHKQEIIASQSEKIYPGLLGIQFFSQFANPSSSYFSWNDLLTQNKKNKDFDTFAEGKTSIIFGLPEDILKLKKIIADKKKLGLSSIPEQNIGVFLLPHFEDKKNPNVIGEIKALGVLSSSKNTDLAWQFLKFIGKKENLRAYAQYEKKTSANLDILLEQESDPLLGPFARQAKFAQSLDLPISKTKWRSLLSNFLMNITPSDPVSMRTQLDAFETQCTDVRKNEKIINQ